MKKATPICCKLAGLILAGLIGISSLPISLVSAAKAETADTVSDAVETKSSYAYGYEEYQEEHQNWNKISQPMTLFPGETAADGIDRDEHGNLKLEDGDRVTWSFEVPSDGYYLIEISYGALMTSNRSSYSTVWYVDGEVPFFEANDISLSKLYVNESDEISLDDFGNEQTPYQVETNQEQTAFLKDTSGYYADPYRFYFQAGVHTLSLEMESGGILLSGLNLKQMEESQSYQQVLQEWKDAGYQAVDALDSPLLIQGESAVLKNDTVLYPRYDNTSAGTMPSNPGKTVLNTIGGQNWNGIGQTITWKCNAPKTGLYRLSFRVRQNYKRGVQVSRKIMINGAVPYEELENIRFPFDNKWYVQTMGDGETDYLVLLEEGENTISMEIVASYPDLVRELNTAVLDLNEFYRAVIMITGTSPDTYQDYDLDRNMPDFEETINNLITQLEGFYTMMEEQGFEKGGESEVINRLLVQLQSFLDEPSKVPFRMTTFQDNISSMASWIQTLSDQPLEVDWLQCLGTGEEPERENAGFFESAAFIFQRLLASFFNDYSSLGTVEEGEKAINVWLSLGRDQAQVIKRLTDDLFEPETGYTANVSLVQQSLIPATLAGTGPDVAIFIDTNTIINLAARNALADISNKDGFEEAKEQFQDASLVPYTYSGGVYGLPVSESFFVTFYRKDIFEELGLSVPDTWDEFYEVLKVLQRNHLQAGVPAPATANTIASQGEVFFQNLLYQHGGTYYKDDWKSTGFDSDAALDALTQWTEFYTKYSLLTDYDLYSRFRTGEMPIGFEQYTFQNQLSVAAPELDGMWGIAPLPGLRQEDGTVNRTVIGATSGIIMFQKADEKKAAWEYLKWFTSTDVQSQYAKEIEALMGEAARHPSANIEAMKSLPWDSKTEEILLEQWSHLEMVQQTPVNYYVSRNITNIFRNVVYYNKVPREVLASYNRDINREIQRRREEFGLDTE